jgi:molybdopterin-binding protein
MFNLKDFIEDQQEGEVSTEVDLSPLLALMVTLIPVLLLQTSFATLKMLETSLPVLSDQVQEKKKEDKNKIDFDLDIFVKNDNSVVVQAQVNKKVVRTKTISSNSKKELNLEVIKDEIIAIKKSYPDQVSAKVTPGDKTKYDNIVQLLDVMRKTDSSRMIAFVDKDGKSTQTDILFPDISFGNITD